MRGQEDEIVVGDFLPAWFAKLLDLSSYEAGVCRLVLHHAPYDLTCFAENYPEHTAVVFRALEGGGVHCTKVREMLLDIAAGTGRKSYSLADICKERFEVELDKTTWRLGYEELEDKPLKQWPQGAIEYALKDAEMARRVYEVQNRDAAELRYEAFDIESSRQTAHSFALTVTSNRGVMLDPDRVQTELAKAVADLDSVTDVLRKNGIFHHGTTKKNMKAIQELVAKSYPGTPPKTPKGKIKTDAEVVAECNHPALEAYSKFQLASKLVNTYLEPLSKLGSGPVHTRYVPLVNSGRTSASEPNLQNLPRAGGVRECFVPREGYVFVFCDFDSQELRTLAQSCKLLVGKSTLADKYADDPDFDPHSDFAARLFKISYEEALQRKEAEDVEFNAMRQRVKAANFGFPVGMAAETFARKCRKDGIDISQSEAEHLRKEWRKQWPEMRQYFDIVQELLRVSGGTIEQLVSGRMRGGCDFTAGANTFFQGLAADASKNALYSVVKACKLNEGALAGCHPILFLHDEIGMEAPVETAAEAALELALTMEDGMEEVCPDVPARCSPLLATRWSKKAKPVFDREGRLIPWNESN